jgi:hypothetical protein
LARNNTSGRGRPQRRVLALLWPITATASRAVLDSSSTLRKYFTNVSIRFLRSFRQPRHSSTIPVLRLSVSLSKEVFLMRSDGMQIFYKKVYLGQIQASQIKALRHHSEQTCRPSSSPYTLPCFLPVDSSRASAYCARNTSNLLMVMATSKEKIQASHQKSSSQDYWLFRF